MSGTVRVERLQEALFALAAKLARPGLEVEPWSHSLGKRNDLDGWSMGFDVRGFEWPLRVELDLGHLGTRPELVSFGAAWRPEGEEPWWIRRPRPRGRSPRAPIPPLEEWLLEELEGLSGPLARSLEQGPMPPDLTASHAGCSWCYLAPRQTPERDLQPDDPDYPVMVAWVEHLRELGIQPIVVADRARVWGSGLFPQDRPEAEDLFRPWLKTCLPRAPVKALADLYSKRETLILSRLPGVELVPEEDYPLLPLERLRAFHRENPKANGLMFLSRVGVCGDHSLMWVSNFSNYSSGSARKGPPSLQIVHFRASKLIGVQAVDFGSRPGARAKALSRAWLLTSLIPLQKRLRTQFSLVGRDPCGGGRAGLGLIVTSATEPTVPLATVLTCDALVALARKHGPVLIDPPVLVPLHLDERFVRPELEQLLLGESTCRFEWRRHYEPVDTGPWPGLEWFKAEAWERLTELGRRLDDGLRGAWQVLSHPVGRRNALQGHAVYLEHRPPGDECLRALMMVCGLDRKEPGWVAQVLRDAADFFGCRFREPRVAPAPRRLEAHVRLLAQGLRDRLQAVDRRPDSPANQGRPARPPASKREHSILSAALTQRFQHWRPEEVVLSPVTMSGAWFQDYPWPALVRRYPALRPFDLEAMGRVPQRELRLAELRTPWPLSPGGPRDWLAFYRRYPDAQGLLRVGAPIVAGGRALVAARNEIWAELTDPWTGPEPARPDGPLPDRFSEWLILEKRRGGWKLTDRLNAGHPAEAPWYT